MNALHLSVFCSNVAEVRGRDMEVARGGTTTAGAAQRKERQLGSLYFRSLSWDKRYTG